MIRLLLALPLLLAEALPTPVDTSTISGVVRFEGAWKPRNINAMIDAMKHEAPARGDKDVFDDSVLVGADGGLANVLVRVTTWVDGKFEAPAAAAELDVAGWFFKPHVVALQVGQPLTLKVSGLDRANFSSKPKSNSGFSVGLIKGGMKEVKFDRREIGIRIQHDCCAFQGAWVHVLDHPFFALTGADGKFEIKGLPPGEYEIEAWHERFGTKTAKVKIAAKETKAQDFTFEKK